MDYKKADYYKLFFRDDYLQYDEIETRRLAELHKLVEDWRDNNLSLWEVIWTLERIMGKCAGGAFRDTIQYEMSNGEESFMYPPNEVVSSARSHLSKWIRPKFLEEESDALRKSIGEISEALKNSEDLTAIDFAVSILGVVLLKAEDCSLEGKQQYSREYATLYDGMVANLEWEEERLKKNKQTPLTGRLHPPVTEEELIARYQPYIGKMREGWNDGGQPKLIRNISIINSGSGQIKLMHYNPDHFPGADGDGDFFDPYEFDERKEYIYGTTIATVTTFSIVLDPESAERLSELAAEVKKALRILGAMPPSFGIPVTYETAPYQRPFYPVDRVEDIDVEEVSDIHFKKSNEKWRHRMPNWWSYSRTACEEYCDVRVTDGRVVVHNRLDLDDTYALYYLLEHLIEPSADIAQAFNRARYAEARSAPQTMAGLNSFYDVSNLDPENRLGHLKYAGPEALETALGDTAKLYFGRQIDEMALVQIAMSLAAQTLCGNIADRHGAFPAEDMLLLMNEENPTAGHGMTTFERNLARRTEQFLCLMAGTEPNSETPLVRALDVRASREFDEITEGWRHDMRIRWSAYARRKRGGGTLDDVKKKMEDHEKAVALSDLMSGYAKRQKRSGDDDSQQLAARTGLVVRDPEVPACMDRTYPHTFYTSRLPESIWPRRELPTALQKWLKPEGEPTRAAKILALAYNTHTF